MSAELQGKKIAIVATDGVEQAELTEPRKAMEEAGAATILISPSSESKIKAWNHQRWGRSFKVDAPITEARAEDYDALILPGGVMNPDKLRRDPQVLRFVKAFFNAGKPVAAICHGPWTLIDAGVMPGRRATSYHSLQTDLENAGANWVDEEVVVDQNLITSRKPDDIPAFNRALIEKLSGRAVSERRAEAEHELAA
jgi:deglycase